MDKLQDDNNDKVLSASDERNDYERLRYQCLKLLPLVKNYPKQGINFRHIGPLFATPDIRDAVFRRLASFYSSDSFDVLAGVESRGFLMLPLALIHKKPFVMVRKPNKLPLETHSIRYGMEYNQQSEIQMEKGAITSEQRVLIADDILATGGTVNAVARLVEMSGAKIAGFCFLAALEGLGGLELLSNYPVNYFVSIPASGNDDD